MTNDPEKRRINNARAYQKRKGNYQGQPSNQNSGDWQDRLGDAFS